MGKYALLFQEREAAYTLTIEPIGHAIPKVAPMKDIFAETKQKALTARSHWMVCSCS